MSPSSPGSSGRVLVILRHAKAEPYADDDHARRLVERGEREADETGRWLADAGVVPTHALVSSAVRAAQTWAHVAAASGSTAEVETSSALYSASADSALDLVRDSGFAAGDVAVLAVVGHNPTLSDLALSLDDGESDPEVFRSLGSGLATAGAAVFEVGVGWRDLGPGTARLVAAHPRG